MSAQERVIVFLLSMFGAACGTVAFWVLASLLQ